MSTHPYVTVYTEPIFVDRWSAVTEDYDGAEDATSPVGWGTTEQEAVDDLLMKLTS